MRKSIVLHILVLLSISNVLFADDFPTESIKALDNSRITTGEVKASQPGISKETITIDKANDVATGSIEPSDNSKITTGEIKPQTKEDGDYALQPQNPEQLFECDDPIAKELNNGPVCGHEYRVMPCLVPPCPEISRWHTYPGVEAACSAKRIGEYASGRCIMKKTERHNPQEQ